MSSKKFVYQHKYSAIEGKAPSASTLMTGEIAVNGAAGNEHLFIKNSNNEVVSFDRILVDSELSSGSTNPVANSAITSVILDNEEVVAAALNDLNDKKAERASAVTDGSISASSSSYTLSFKNESGDTLFNLEFEKGGDGKPILEGTDIKIVSGETADTIYVSADTEINSASTHVVQAKTIHAELEKKQVKNIELTEDEYQALVTAGTLDEEALYIITDAQAIDASKFVTSGSVNTTASTSAYTLVFSGDNGSLFDLEIPKGGDGKKVIAGDNISITSGLTADTISVSGASAISSSSTEVVQSKVIYEELDKKLDKVNFINNLYPKGSVYITYEYKNPSTFIGGEWELIGGEDANKNYYPAFAIATDSAGTTINESLPNITGSVAVQSAFNSTFAPNGAFTQDSTLYEEVVDGSGPRKRGPIWFNATRVSSIYQNGAHVNVNAIKIFFWRRTDDGEIVEQITPLDVDIEDVLWEGSTSTSGAFTLSNDINNYKYLKFYTTDHSTSVNRMVDRVDVKDINASTSSAKVIIENAWDSTLRYCTLYKLSDTSLQLELQSETVLKITGVRAIPTTDISAIDFQTYYKTVSMTTVGSFTADITVPSGYVPLGLGSTIIRTDGAVGYGYCDKVTKVSDTQYRFTGWANPNGIGSGGDSITVYATFIKGPYTNLVEFVTAGDGINVSDTGTISVAPLQKVTCTKTSLIGSEFYFGGEYYPALKTVHIHGGFAPTTGIANNSGICRLTIGDKQVIFDDNVVGYVMCNNNGTYMRFCQSTLNGNQITARDLTIDTGRFYWLDLWCPAHLA